MKILAIRIKNLASLEGITEIDFTQEPLCSAGIFSITGPTGAGKSTILDALCLALYAKTPRYKQAESGVDIYDVQGASISQNDVRGILRDGTAEGFAEVDFVGVDNQPYRATWMVRRARNRADGNLQAFDVALKNISTNSPAPGRKTELLTEIERLVGLSFEQFTRSVLLAQGDFTAFLKAGKDEKSALLEKLTGTHIYSEISRRIYEKHREQAQQLRDLNSQREGIQTMTSEELTSLQEQKDTVEKDIQAQEKLLLELSKEISWHEQLNNLQSRLDAAKLVSEQTFAVKQEAIPREQQLQQIVSVQSVKPVVAQLNTVQGQINAKRVSLEQIRVQLNALQQKKDALDITLQQTEDNLTARIAEEEAALPLLNEAKTLDVQLAEKELQTSQAQTTFNTASQKLQQQQQQLTQKQLDAEQLESKVKELQQWKESNTARQPIAEQHSLIISKLNDAGILLETQKNRFSLVLAAEEEIKVQEQERQRLSNEFATLQTSLQQARQEYESQKEEFSVISIASLDQQRSALDETIEDIIAAEAHWKILSSAITEQTKITEQLEENRKQLKADIEQLGNTKALLETNVIQRNTSLSMLEKARLVAAENVESLRTKLVADEPCPVCGSTSHPYAGLNTQLDHVLKELEISHQKIETAYTDTLTTHSRLTQVCDQLNKTIATQEKDLSLKEKSVKQLEDIWGRFKIHASASSIAFDERATWLHQKLQQEKDQQRELRDTILSYNNKKEQLEKQKGMLDESDKQLVNIANALKDTERTLKSIEEQRDNHKLEREKAETGLEDLQQNLAVYFTSEQWFQQWKKEADKFVLQIQEFAAQWIHNIQQLEEGLQQKEILAATLKGIQEQLIHLSEETSQKEQALLKIREQWNDLSGKRKAIFNGAPISAIEKGFKDAIIKARQVLDQQKSEKEILLASLTRTTTQCEETEKELSVHSEQETSFKQQIQEWLNSYNQRHSASLSKNELDRLLSFTPDWIEKERLELRAIDDAVTQAKSVLAEREENLDKHRQEWMSERTAEELITLHTEAKLHHEQNNQTSNEITFRLREDATNKQRIGTLLQSIETLLLVVDNWAKLNEVIGSADGKKFRQIAQEYTLDVLLSYANVHLVILSKRYVLQRIPNSLGLQVLDQDMGDEIRTVYSLSGGESFLVSLALALGLASLSSSRMKVESLFIDEGFGSLDPATLNIAMDALERLHNQGRKVGVISHVQEMTERIPVQIRVSKQQSGKSNVEILGV
ncbi:AAA family ATPase [Chitinophaga sancti]|uniref:AAA family ATPase n=1 Tax=Chitinophaga sancti TaxID=1004 RepID=UPI002A7662AC|nr:AAA family ATPase [Chitinophaga sancti]WPQ66088.1 AAA family ATPase [Chitinophaga sancti]